MFKAILMIESSIYDSIYNLTRHPLYFIILIFKQLIQISMHAYIAALLSAVALAATKTKPAGGYKYLTGGEDWGTYYSSMEGNICGSSDAKEQSPVNLVTEGDSVVFDKDMDIVISGLGSNSVGSIDFAAANHEVNWQFDFGSWKDTATVTRTDGSTKVDTFNPVQIHWHTPSENTIDGQFMAAEAHLVSQRENGDYAVVGFFFDNEGQDVDNDFVKSFLAGFDDRNNSDENAKAKVDMDLITRKVNEEGDGFWQFMGSFTTPPCTEGVYWTVMATVQPISSSQLTKLHAFTKGAATGNEAGLLEATYVDYLASNTANTLSGAGNNRAVQPLNDRKLYFNNGSNTKNGVPNVDSSSDSEDDAASAMMASAFTAAAVTFLSF